MPYEFRLPDIGEGLHEAEILQWYVQLGQEIESDAPIAEIQTDKASVEMTSPVAGRILSLSGPAGSTVRVGEVLLTIETASRKEMSTTHLPQETVEKYPVVDQMSVPQTDLMQAGKYQASPAVRKLARDLGVNLATVIPTGVNGRMTRADIQRAKDIHYETEAKREHTNSDRMHSLPSEKRIENSLHENGEAEEWRESIRGIRKQIYESMTKSMYTAPQATGMSDLDATQLTALRSRLLPFAEARNLKLTYLPLIIKVVAQVLKLFPIFNATVDDEALEIIYKRRIHMGIATATPHGLIVPVIRDADRKSLFEIAAELEDLTSRARDRKLQLHELTGSTFTISNTGVHGGWFATPILNYPEVAILGIHSIEKRAVVLSDDSIAAQSRMSFSLSFDHRVIDGDMVGLFMHRFKEYMENPEAVLLL